MCMVALIWMLTTTLYAQNVTVSGIVKDPTGEPVIGASVTVKGANTGTVTNIDGRYTLQCPAKATLVFSYLGLKTKNVEVNGGGVDNKLTLTLKTTPLLLTKWW